MIDKIYDLMYERCGKCPAFYHEDTFGEYVEGCCLKNDTEDICKYSVYPHWIVKILLKQYFKKEEEYWDKLIRKDEEEQTK